MQTAEHYDLLISDFENTLPHFYHKYFLSQTIQKRKNTETPEHRHLICKIETIDCFTSKGIPNFTSRNKIDRLGLPYETRILVLLVISYFRNLPKIRRVDAALALLALFSAVHLYVPSMSFVTFGTSSWDPSSVLFLIVSEVTLPSLNVQVIAGFGKPAALQTNLAVLPSGTVWFLGNIII